MGHVAEITREVFKTLVPNTLPCTLVETLENARFTYYTLECGTTIVHVNNFVSATDQYYIHDING